MMENVIGGPTLGLRCKTDLNKQKESKGTTFNWTISGLLDRRDVYNEGQAVMSKEFILPTPDGKDTKWVLELVPKFNSDSVKVMIHSRNNFDVDTRIEMTVIDCNGAKCFVNYNFYDAQYLSTFIGGTKKNIWQLAWSSLKQPQETGWRAVGNSLYMPKGDLTFNFELIVYGKPKTTNENDLNLGEFYLSSELTDVLIKCQNKSFKAHKVILSASSPVFRAMFQADMKESSSQEVVIKDIEPDIVEEMLKFIYTCSCCVEENSDLDFVSNLLVASDKYQMKTLKNVCQSQLSSHLQVDNSLKVTTKAKPLHS